MRNAIIFLLGSTGVCAGAAVANAGYTIQPGVTITEPYAQYDGWMRGSLIGARNAPNNLEYIDCDEYRCWMRDATGKTAFCYALDEELRAPLRRVNDASYVSLFYDDAGWLGMQCKSVSVTTSSRYLP
jgi:hypothetical protein